MLKQPKQHLMYPRISWNERINLILLSYKRACQGPNPLKPGSGVWSNA
jgi:hypothetical protein